jgi:hypothetical protein
MAPPDDVLMLSQPAPGQLTDGSAGSDAATANREAELLRRRSGAGRARGVDDALAARALAAARLKDAELAVDDVVNGPLSSEQPDEQPVAAGPTNVGENCPKLDVLTALAGAPVALPLATARTQKAPSNTTGTNSNESRFDMARLCMR